jgi:peptide/nickel transport system substrate-binding protein
LQKFSDIRIRQALTLAFDGPSINKTLFHGRFVRTDSFFARSELSSTGRPADPDERDMLEPYSELIRPDIMNGSWRLPNKADVHEQRENLRKAFELLQEAGYVLKGQRLIHESSKRPFNVDFLVTTTGQERIALTFASTLRRLGVTTSIRKIEPSQFWSRIGNFDFDIIQWHYSASLSPGNEQINRWSSSAADIKRSLNYAGAKNPAVDAMIDKMLQATERPEFTSAVRALDRALLSGNYLIPLFHVPKAWYAVWHTIGYPPQPPLLGTDFATWWHGPSAN